MAYFRDTCVYHKSAHGRLHPVQTRPIIAQIAFLENGGGEQRMRLQPDAVVGS
jgi:hypothetical protein